MVTVTLPAVQGEAHALPQLLTHVPTGHDAADGVDTTVPDEEGSTADAMPSAVSTVIVPRLVEPDKLTVCPAVPVDAENTSAATSAFEVSMIKHPNGVSFAAKVREKLPLASAIFDAATGGVNNVTQ